MVITWLYNGAGRSVLVAALFHSAFNSAIVSGGMRYMCELVPGPEASGIAFAVLAAAAVLAVLLTRGRLAYAPERAAP